MKNSDSSTSLVLTASQAAAVQDLQFFLDLHREGVRSVAGVRTRPFPLLIAPSGTGKTSLVQYVSAAANLPVFSINVANWIIRGARSEQHTLTQIAQFIQSNATGVIFLDEVNKLSRQHAADSSWCSDSLSELIAFLDADSRLKAMGIGDAVEHLRRIFLSSEPRRFRMNGSKAEARIPSVS